eukprot:jgi/Undpi1/6725/HiC_scaffold_20.g09204.m1
MSTSCAPLVAEEGPSASSGDSELKAIRRGSSDSGGSSGSSSPDDVGGGDGGGGGGGDGGTRVRSEAHARLAHAASSAEGETDTISSRNQSGQGEGGGVGQGGGQACGECGSRQGWKLPDCKDWTVIPLPEECERWGTGELLVEQGRGGRYKFRCDISLVRRSNYTDGFDASFVRLSGCT